MPKKNSLQGLGCIPDSKQEITQQEFQQMAIKNMVYFQNAPIAYPASMSGRLPETSEINWSILLQILYQLVDKDKLMKLDTTIQGNIEHNEVSSTNLYIMIKDIVGNEVLEQATQIMQTQDVTPAKTRKKTPSARKKPSEKLGICPPMSSTPGHAGSSTKTPRKKSSAQKKKPSEILANLPLSASPANANCSLCVNSSAQRKRLFDTISTSPPVSSISKRQKTPGKLYDQSIDELNDVISASGINLAEEELLILSTVEEYKPVSETTQRVMLEAEESVLLEKDARAEKIENIILKHGLKSISSDVPGIISMCVEEYLRCLIIRLIRQSKQIDTEMGGHQAVITSDIRQQIFTQDQKAKEERDKNLVEKTGRSEKSNEANKEEVVNLKLEAADFAARAALGRGNDMLLRWQLKTEQALQWREGLDRASVLNPVESSITRASTNLTRSFEEKQSCGNKGPSTILVPRPMKFANQQEMSPPKMARSISIKDVISTLERDPQMSKSTLIYRLYEKF